MGGFTLNNDYDDLIAMIKNVKPKNVNGLDNTSAQYYTANLLKKIFAVFTIENIPDTWDYDYLINHLFINGIIGVSDTSVGVVPLKCGFTGDLNIYDKPTQLLFTNVVLGSFTKTINKDCVYLHINNDFSGVMGLVNKYAVQLAMCDASIGMNLLNSRVAFVGEASNQSQAKVLQKIYTLISKGEPCVVYKNQGIDKGMNWYWNDVKRTFIADTILECKKAIMDEFLTEIGVKTTNTLKKERLVTDEANSSMEEKEISIYTWKKNLENDITKVNKMFGLNLSLVKNEFGEQMKVGEYIDAT